MFRTAFLVLGFACFTFDADPADAQPSFDCTKAATMTEHAICASLRLAELDRKIAAAYSSARSAGGASVRDEQRAWLDQRDQCGGDFDCLGAVMQNRLLILQAALAAPSRATGLYCGDATVLGLVDRNETATFDFLHFNAFGHACGFGPVEGRREGDAWVATESGCTLELAAREDGLHLTAEPFDICKSNYCGARAAIGNTLIPYAWRQVGIADPFAVDAGERCW